MSEDAGAGSVLAVGIAGALVAALLIACSLDAALVARQVAASAADAAALAGAEVAAGGAPGIPCAVAARLAVADGAARADCAQHGVVVTVRTRVAVGPFSAAGEAVAGPASTR